MGRAHVLRPPFKLFYKKIKPHKQAYQGHTGPLVFFVLVPASGQGKTHPEIRAIALPTFPNPLG